MNYVDIIKNGIVKENPTFVLMLGMCPTLATTMAVLICTNFVISCLKSVTPDKVRIPVFIVVIAAFVTMLQLVIKAFLPDIDAALGLFIPLIVVNCIILGRAEAFAAKNSPVASLFDGIGIGLGFTLGLTLAQVLSSDSPCCPRPTTSCSSCCLRVHSSPWASWLQLLTSCAAKL